MLRLCETYRSGTGLSDATLGQRRQLAVNIKRPHQPRNTHHSNPGTGKDAEQGGLKPVDDTTLSTGLTMHVPGHDRFPREFHAHVYQSRGASTNPPATACTPGCGVRTLGSLSTHCDLLEKTVAPSYRAITTTGCLPRSLTERDMFMLLRTLQHGNNLSTLEHTTQEFAILDSSKISLDNSMINMPNQTRPPTMSSPIDVSNSRRKLYLFLFPQSRVSASVPFVPLCSICHPASLLSTSRIASFTILSDSKTSTILLQAFHHIKVRLPVGLPMTSPAVSHTSKELGIVSTSLSPPYRGC